MEIPTMIQAATTDFRPASLVVRNSPRSALVVSSILTQAFLVVVKYSSRSKENGENELTMKGNLLPLPEDTLAIQDEFPGGRAFEVADFSLFMYGLVRGDRFVAGEGPAVYH